MFARQFRPSDGRILHEGSEDALSRSITSASRASRKVASIRPLSLSAPTKIRGRAAKFTPSLSSRKRRKRSGGRTSGKFRWRSGGGTSGKCSLGVETREITSCALRAGAARLKDSRVKVTVHAEIPAKANEIRSTMNWSFAEI